MGLWHWFLQRGSARPTPCLNTDWGEEASSRVCKTGRAVVQPLQRAGPDSGMNPELWHINRPAVRSHFHRAVDHGATSSPAVEKPGVGGARGAPAGKGEAALPDAAGNLLQRSGAVGARIVFIGDQPIQRPVFGVGGKLRFMHYRRGSAARQDSVMRLRPSAARVTRRPVKVKPQMPDAVGNLLQPNGAVGASIVFVGDQPTSQWAAAKLMISALRACTYRVGESAKFL